MSYETWDQVLKSYPWRSLDEIAGWTSGGKALNVGGDPILLNGGIVSPNLFELLDAHTAMGRSFGAEVLSVTIVAGMAAARRATRVSVMAALRSD